MDKTLKTSHFSTQGENEMGRKSMRFYPLHGETDEYKLRLRQNIFSNSTRVVSILYSLLLGEVPVATWRRRVAYDEDEMRLHHHHPEKRKEEIQYTNILPQIRIYILYQHNHSTLTKYIQYMIWHFYCNLIKSESQKKIPIDLEMKKRNF